MQLKKLLQGSAFALVAAACAIALPSAVQAADVTGTTAETKVGTIAVDGPKAQLTVTGATDKEVLVGFAKVNKKGKVTVASWDTYDGTSATVDLSKLSNTKDNYVAVTTPEGLAKDAITIVKIPAVKKVVKAEYDAAADKISFGEADKGKPTTAELSKTDTDDNAASKFEYRTAYSGWESMKGASDVVSLAMYQEEGANLFVRRKGVKETSFPTAQGDATYTFGANEKLKAYETTSSLPGKEAKLVIKAKAKGPKVTADYVKGTVKLPKNAEYRLSSSAKVQEPDNTTKQYTQVGAAAKTETVADLAKLDSAVVTTTTKEFAIEVRTAADAAKKKAASKWSRLSIAVPAALENVAKGEANTSPQKPTNGTYAPGQADATYGGKGVKDAKIKPDASSNDSLIAFSYVKKGKKLPQYQQEDAVVVENKDADHGYEIAITAGTATEVGSDAKVSKLAKGAGKKLTLTGVADGSKVWVRVQGDKKSKTWVGKYTEVGVVDYTFIVPKAETQAP